jgi:hypothetical protein
MGEIDEKSLNLIKDILKNNDIEYAALFGSRARGDNRSDSDFDILIRFKKNKEKGLFGFISLQEEISKILDKKVDLVTQDSISPYIKGNIVKDLRVII